MYTDLSFFTNEPESKLLDRFKSLLKHVQFFDILVGYFRTSGFFHLYESFEKIEKIRILVGLNVDNKTFELIQTTKIDTEIDFESHKKTKEVFGKVLINEIQTAPDSKEIELGIKKFIEYLKKGKIEIKAHPSQRIHAKVYISRYKEDDHDFGNVITGSSNFSESGLINNYEFNVQLKNSNDVRFALDKFEQFWAEAVDVSENYVDTIKHATYLTDKISPYELFLKLLYEYFREDLSLDKELFYKNFPKGFMKLRYQEQAVLNAKKILEEYGGVFLSDVVGLGKTYIAAMLASQLSGRNLVIASPSLLNEENPNSWTNVFYQFNISSFYKSIGKLESIVERGTDWYDNVFIDEAHKFRNESNISYELLSQICRGKKVILVTATPLNNKPEDILAQIKLFQKGKNSTIPGIKNLDAFFATLQKQLDGLDRKKDYEDYMIAVKRISQIIRDRILKYIMVRRTREEIKKFFEDDLKVQGLKFPEVEAPTPIYYQLDSKLDFVFTQTIRLITDTTVFKYARYTPLLYQKREIDYFEKTSQVNMRGFMKILLIKRLESSFYAFKQSINRFIKSYQDFITVFDDGYIFLSKKHSAKIIELFINEDFEAIEKLIEEEKAEKIPADFFTDAFKIDLESDLETLKKIKKLWTEINYDPKLNEFINQLKSVNTLKKNKILIFTESKETAEYLHENLLAHIKDKPLLYHGGVDKNVLKTVIANFDAKASKPQDDYRVLITTEILSEGVNLHRANVVVNYDIPWNPTRMIQRVGRINRVDTQFNKVYTYNFFPTQQSNDIIKLQESAIAKITYFIEMLGNDAKLLTDGEEVKSFELFNKLTSKEYITGEDNAEDSELKYFKIIVDIRDNNIKLFDKIKHLPKKARTARDIEENIKLNENTLISYFRKGKMEKFYIANETESKEIDFISAARILECTSKTRKSKIGENYYDLLEKNKNTLINNLTEEEIEMNFGGGSREHSVRILKILRALKKFKGFTEDNEHYLREVIRLLEDGAIPKNITKRLYDEIKDLNDPLKIINNVRRNIADEFFKGTNTAKDKSLEIPSEVILSEYFVKI